jgi:hypothetical protein
MRHLVKNGVVMLCEARRDMSSAVMQVVSDLIIEYLCAILDLIWVGRRLRADMLCSMF